MPENLFEKIEHLSEQLEQASKQAAQDKQDILDAIANQNAKQNSTIQPQVAQVNARLSLQNFLKRSTKEYHFFGDKEEFNKSKMFTLLSLMAAMIVGVVMNILTTKGCGIFSTFTMIEDLWLFLVFRMICHTIHSKRFYDHIDYSCHSYEKFIMNADILYCPVGTKKSYKVIRVLSIISAVCNIIYLCMNAKGAITVWAVIFELLFLASIFFAMYMMIGHFCMYNLIYYSGKDDAGTQKVTIIHDTTANQLYEKSDYESRFPFAK